MDLVQVWEARPSGFTNTGEALKVARELVEKSSQDLKIIYLITDGFPEAYTEGGRGIAGDNARSMAFALEQAAALVRVRNVAACPHTARAAREDVRRGRRKDSGRRPREAHHDRPQPPGGGHAHGLFGHDDGLKKRAQGAGRRAQGLRIKGQGSRGQGGSSPDLRHAPCALCPAPPKASEACRGKEDPQVLRVRLGSFTLAIP